MALVRRGWGRVRHTLAAEWRRGRLRLARMGLLTLAAGLLLGAVLLGEHPRLRAQDGDGTPGGEGVSIRLGDLSSYPTHTTLDRFTVDLSNLTATVAYHVSVSSDNATALGIGGCGTATQTRAVTGVETHSLTFIAYACAVGGGTVTADVRPAGASSPAATVSQRLTVEPVPETAPGAEVPAGQSAPQGQAQVTRPGAVPSIRFPDGDRKPTSVKVTWDAPSDGGGRALTGFGLLFWRKGTTQPAYSQAFVAGAASRSHTYTGLQPNTTYQFRIHACNGPGSCGWWTNPPKEVTTRPPPPTPKPTARPATAPDKVRALTATGGNAQISVTWQQPTSGGSSHLTGYHVQHRQDGAVWPVGADIVTPGTKTSFTIRNLTNGQTYDVRVRACNGASLCGAWVADEDVWVPPPYIHLPKDTIEVGERMKIGAHDVPKGAVAYIRIEGPIQPEGRCQSQGSAQRRGGPRASTGPGYYDSMWIDGCAPGDAKIRLETQDGSTVFDQEELKVVAAATERPGRVAQPQITEYNAALKVAWRPPADGGAPRHYDVRDRAGTSGPWRQRRSPDNQSMILDQLTNGQLYEVQVRACNQHGCSLKWSETATGTPSATERTIKTTGTTSPVSTDPECPTTSATAILQANAQLDVVPLPKRMATLCWSPLLFAESYVIEATDNINNLHDPNKSDWQRINGTTEQDPVPDTAQRVLIDLDSIITKSGAMRGLANNASYGIRVGMTFTTSGTTRTAYGTPIIIIDTPITKADGSNARAEVTWDLVGAATVLNSTNFGTGYYEIRWRQSTVDHVLASWKPDEDGFLPPPSDVSFRVTPSTHVIGGLAAGSVYALQLIYRDDPTQTNERDADVFAARNAFVWPSTAKADGGQRVAAFPLQQRLGARTADGYPLYAYRICTETFRPSSDTRIAAWVTLINHAMQQWQTATDGLIQTERETDTSGQFKPCADYAGLIRVIADDIAMFKPAPTPSEDEQLKQLIQDFLQRFKDMGIILDDKKIEEKYGDEDHTLRDIDANEIIMFNEGHPIDTITRVVAFPEFATDVRLEEPCWYFSSGVIDDAAKMCVPGGDTGPDGTRDIFIRRKSYEGVGGEPVDPLAVPAANARFNKCLNQGDDVDLSAYGDFLHESGHVLGIGGAGSGHPGEAGQERFFFDSVMDYNPSAKQPNCAPYPLDIMAIYALYQVVVP